MGLSGLNTPAVVERLEDFALPFDPDLVIYGYTINDIENEHYRSSFRKSQVQLSKYYASPSHMWRLIGSKGRSLSNLLFTPIGTYFYEVDDNYFHNPEAWQVVLDAMDRLARIARERDTCVLLLLHSRLEALNVLHPYHDCYDLVAEAGQKRGFHIARSFDYVRGLEPTALWIAPADPHPNQRGHELFARAALAGLEALPPSCWQRR